MVSAPLDSLSAPVLDLKVIHIHALDITEFCEGNDSICHGNQILHGDIILVKSDGGLSVIPVFFGNALISSCNHGKQTFLVRKNRFQFPNPLLAPCTPLPVCFFPRPVRARRRMST